MRETCTKNTFREESGVIHLLPRSEVSSVNYDCSFKIHLPVGRKIALNISVIPQQPTDEVDEYNIIHTSFFSVVHPSPPASLISYN